jgi:hypothetical protein
VNLTHFHVVFVPNFVPNSKHRVQVQRFRASQANPVENARHKFQANQSRCFNPAIVSRSNRVAIQQ